MASPEDKKSLEDERDSLSKDLSIKVVVGKNGGISNIKSWRNLKDGGLQR